MAYQIAFPIISYRHVENEMINEWLEKNGFEITYSGSNGAGREIHGIYKTAGYNMIIDAEIYDYDRPVFHFEKNIIFNLCFKLHTTCNDGRHNLENYKTLNALEAQHKKAIRESI